MDKLLTFSGVTKSYGLKFSLSDVNLSITSGKIIGLLGPNGSGKSTMIKLICGLLTPNSGEILINGEKPSELTKAIVSYLPERTYFSNWMRVSDLLNFFEDFYEDFDRSVAGNMLSRLNINIDDKLKIMSKGTKEKVQLILVMSRKAGLYLLDEPIGGVDPAARDYILNTIITNYNPNASVIISTHLISDIERVLDEVIFISNGKLMLHDTVDNIRSNMGKSVDEHFREVFKC